MGLGMAQSLRRAGLEPSVFDIRADIAARFTEQGGTACLSIKELGSRCNIVISVVVNAEQTESVLWGPEGCVAAMRPGGVFVMCSTVDPNWSIRTEKLLAEKGILYLDAPISGGAARAANGEITMMTSGHPDAYALAQPCLDAMAAKVYQLDNQAGAGSRVKIINQLLAGVHIAAAAEAMALGIREGIDPDALYEVITNSAGNSWMFQNRMAHVLAADYTPHSAVDIFVKDLGLVLDLARASKFPLPLSSTAHQMFMQA